MRGFTLPAVCPCLRLAKERDETAGWDLAVLVSLHQTMFVSISAADM